jgi:MFS family permease
VFNQPINRWWTVVAGAMGAAVGSGVVVVFALGVFAKSIASEYGWSRSSVSLALTAFAITSGFGIFTLGMAIDRLGLRRVAIIYVALFGCAIATVPFVGPHLGLFIATFAIMGLFGSAATVMPYAVAVCAWFNQKRGLALGLVNAGTGVGAALLPLYSQFLLRNYGWRVGYWGVAAMAAAVAIFGVSAFVRLPAAYEEERRAMRMERGNTSDSLRTIMKKNGTFWLIAFAIFVVSVATFGVISQIISLVTDRGLTAMEATTILSTAGIGSLLARLVVGYTLDRIFAAYVVTGVFAIAMGGMALLIGAKSVLVLTLGAVMVGIAAGAEGDILTFLVSRYFPLRSFGSIAGAIWLTWAWGGALGTYLLALSFDLTHTYTIAIVAYIVALAVGIGAILQLGPYVFPQERGEIRPREKMTPQKGF